MSFPKRKVVYTLISLLLLASVAALAVMTWRARVRYRASMTITVGTHPSNVAQRQVADLTYIAKTMAVHDDAKVLLDWERASAFDDRTAESDALATLQVKQIGHTNRFTMEVTSEREEPAKRAVDALSRTLIRRFGELAGAGAQEVRIAGRPETARVRDRLTTILYIAVAFCRPVG